jgi:hypothetical protein
VNIKENILWIYFPWFLNIKRNLKSFELSGNFDKYRIKHITTSNLFYNKIVYSYIKNQMGTKIM